MLEEKEEVQVSIMGLEKLSPARWNLPKVKSQYPVITLSQGIEGKFNQSI